MARFITKYEAARLIGFSGPTLKKYRQIGLLIQDVHWIRLNSRTIRYNLDLLQDWVANRADPQSHRRAIENYQVSLVSNQKRGRRDALKTSKQKPVAQGSEG